jgi:hypothetical protein
MKPRVEECKEALLVLIKKYAEKIVTKESVPIPDEEEALNWHAFLGHSQDMQGFDAGKFSGADPWSKKGNWRSLKERNLSVTLLSQLWAIEPIHDSLTAPKSSLAERLEAISRHGQKPGFEFVEAWRGFKGRARKTKAILRAYLDNPHRLKPYGHSFRNYLERLFSTICPHVGFPPRHFQSGDEARIVQRIDLDFYNVGPAMASYMICDWLLYLWRKGTLDWFETFKCDSRHMAFAEKYGNPYRTQREFVKFVQAVQEGCGKKYPPRVVNEAIWLDAERGGEDGTFKRR